MEPYATIKWVESQVNTIGHTNRDFMEHLFGTYDILRSWGEDIDLCYAGLCHSLYETTYFKNESLRDKITREQLVDIIGPQSEYLVYLFCKMTDRSYNIKNNTFKFPPELHLPLLKLELANFIEQMDSVSQWSNEFKSNTIDELINCIKVYQQDFKIKKDRH